MQDKLVIKNNYVIFNGPKDYTLKFNNIDELCEILFNFFNYADYCRVYLNKKVNFKNGSQYKIIKEGTYIFPQGLYRLNIIVDKVYLNTVKMYLREFHYEKFNPNKKLTREK